MSATIMKPVDTISHESVGVSATSSFETMNRELRAREERRYRRLVNEIRGSVARASDLSLATLAELSDAKMEHNRRLAIIVQAVEARAMMDE